MTGVELLVEDQSSQLTELEVVSAGLEEVVEVVDAGSEDQSLQAGTAATEATKAANAKLFILMVGIVFGRDIVFGREVLGIGY